MLICERRIRLFLIRQLLLKQRTICRLVHITMKSPIILKYDPEKSLDLEMLLIILTSYSILDSFLKAGVEASTLLGMLYELPQHSKVFGFDISWSRTAYARKLINDFFPERTGVDLCTGELEHLPFPDSSVDVVHTSHALEPNGGREKYILQELHRVCSEYLVLIEPAYEFANSSQQLRMRKHGYCTDLLSHINELGYNLVSNTLLEDSMNPDNPSMMITIKKSTIAKSNAEFVFPLRMIHC